MKRKLFIFGTGNFAEMAHYLFTSDSDYEVAGFTVDARFLKGDRFLGLPVVAYEEFRANTPRGSVDVFAAVGVGRINNARAEKVALLTADGFRLASFLSSRAHVPKDLVLHPNTMIMDGVILHPGVRVGADTIIWSRTGIALKAEIGNHVWITSATLGESTVIGDYSFIGLNATVAPNVKVGSHNLIGAAAVILRDTSDYQVYRGPRSVAARVSSLRIRDLSIIH